VLPQLVSNADLTEGRLLNGERNDGILDLLRLPLRAPPRPGPPQVLVQRKGVYCNLVQ
jgi:hypothetical protein